MLIPKTEFIGLEDLVHLATGGESPILKSHQKAVDRFFADKGLGEESRERQEETFRRCKEKVAQLLSGTADDVTFLSSASEGINLVAHALDWRPGDNVVVGDVEFPSDVLPWTHLESAGVEVRIVRHRDWRLELDDIATAIDERTRVVAISYVSYFTGQRQDLPALSRLVRGSNALLLLDATHAAGVVPVDAHYADILVSSCYKWLLGVHGVGIFYWNQKRVPNLTPPFLGWNTGETIPNWDAPTDYTFRSGADRFLAGNPNFMGLYILENALDTLDQIGPDAIETHALLLSGKIHDGLRELGWQVMTPRQPAERAGNICFIAPDIDAVTTRLAENNVLIWGGYGGVTRVRVSAHLYNDEQDVERFLDVLGGVVQN